MSNNKNVGTQPIINLLIIAFLLLGFYAILDQTGLTKSSNKKSNSKSALVERLNDRYVGRKYDTDVAYELIENYGSPETLDGTDNNIWIAYFPEGNFTMRQTKGDYIIKNFVSGRKPGR